MVQFSKLQLTGFKSFAETTAIDILPGLNGIIGPNGCGKSNLVEALRWLMGENSAKNMRGLEMDDVIFAGTKFRPARGFGEVLLTLENPTGDAPEPYGNEPSIEVSRRIERGMGSDYRVNGKIVRAGDVRMLFADTATGAHSPAIVSQGRVSDIIQAKPKARRRILEDAAGISGLEGRRKEAEQRLRAAEKNLTRVDDVLGEKETLHKNLVKQAAQARRYRKVSEKIRRLEALLAYREWQETQEKAQTSKQQMHELNDTVNQAKQSLFDAQKALEQAQNDRVQSQTAMGDLRERASRLAFEKEKIESRAQKRLEDLDVLDQQIKETEQDLETQKTLMMSLSDRVQELTLEKETLEQSIVNFEQERLDSEQERDKARQSLEASKDVLNALRAQQNQASAQRKALEQTLKTRQAEQEDLMQSKSNTHQQISTLETEMGQQSQAVETTSLQEIVSQIEMLQQEETSLRQNLTELDEKLKQETQLEREAAADLARTESEIKTIQDMVDALEQTGAGNFKPVIAGMSVADGYEGAVVTALGQAAKASDDEGAPLYWTKENATELSCGALPENVGALSSCVSGNDKLTTILSFVGVVDDQNMGDRLQSKLSVGQSLVTKDGHYWRWDGLVALPEAGELFGQKQEQQLLQQKNRLKDLQNKLSEKQDAANEAQVKAEKCRLDLQVKRENIDVLIKQRRELVEQQSSLQREQQQREQRYQISQARLVSLQEKATDIQTRLDKISGGISETTQQLDNLPAEDNLDQEIEQSVSAVNDLEVRFNQAQHNYVTINGAYQNNKQRLTQITQDVAAQSSQTQGIQERLSAQKERLQNLQEKQKNLLSAPQDDESSLLKLAQDAQQVDAQIQAQQAVYDQTFNRFQECNTQVQNCQEIISQGREQLARVETHYQNSQENLVRIEEHIAQTFNCEVVELQTDLEISADDMNETTQGIKSEFERLSGERERIGAVNLRAEEEVQEIGQEIETLTNEKAEIIEAIDKLRQAISKLNRDARRKMMAAFDQVNERFKNIFTRLFNGGEAYLEMLHADDPLDAGLEIYASPPGKRLQHLSLLSGGEQSMTAIALLFAMFLTNPSPICVLDEIDAPLDDANVERMCDLLTEFAKEYGQQTRFLIITHNPITMAAMDRLYGVTMAEKGVSKLVSVDLAQVSVNEQQELEIA